MDRPGAGAWVPAHPTLRRLRAAAADCRGCELWRDATQVVFGEGAASAPFLLVGEQPGDQEDLAGEPFVGPAGRVLRTALQDAGIASDDVYLTNAVKHFRFERRGKRRIHEKPAVGHIVACHPWLEAEIRVERPDIVVCLGATAARAVLGRSVTIGSTRGTVMRTDAAPPSIVTVHPSSILRERDAAEREAAYDAFVRDLVVAREAVTR